MNHYIRLLSQSFFALFFLFSLNSQTWAQEGTETQLSPEAIKAIIEELELNEGTQTTLDKETLLELEPWMHNTELSLQDALRETDSLRPTLAKEQLVRRIQQVVHKSAPKRTELLMRYVLNRSLKVVERMEKYGDTSQPGQITQINRVLRTSIQLSLKYYQSDLKFLQSENQESFDLPLAAFGVEYATFLLSINESQLNAKGQYSVGLFILGLLQVDLARDKNAKAYAPAIRKLSLYLESAPKTPPNSDADSIALMRGLRATLQSVLKIAGTPALPLPSPRQPNPSENSNGQVSGKDGPIKIGDLVVKTHSVLSKITVVAIGESGHILGSDNTWYNPEYIQKILFDHETYNGHKTGSHVVEIFGPINVRRILAITANGVFLLDDQRYYDSIYIDGLTSSTTDGRFKVGDRVLEKLGSFSIIEITNITKKNYIQGSDSIWYDVSALEKVQDGRGQ